MPDGTETLGAGNIGSLQRTFTNAAGQLVWTDRYYLINSLTYSQAVGADGSGNPADLGTSGTNYSRTVDGYDVDGRISRIVLPTGTIYRMVFDDLNRVVSYWVGTNDTPASGSWSPSNNGGSSNMKDFECTRTTS